MLNPLPPPGIVVGAVHGRLGALGRPPGAPPVHVDENLNSNASLMPESSSNPTSQIPRSPPWLM